MKNSSPQDREIAHWQKWQDRADRLWGWQTPAGQHRAARRATLFHQLGGMGPLAKVLELGCGTGEFSKRIAPCVGELWATDLSPDLLRRAERRIREECPVDNVVFAQQDAMQLTLPDASFDTVFGCSVLHHLDAARALREAWRVLRPGGWCVFSEPNMLNPQIAVQKNIGFIKRRMGDTEDETAFFRGPAARLIESAGFEEIEVRHFDFLHPFTPVFMLGCLDQIGRFLEECPGIRAISGSLMMCGRKPLAR